MNRPTGKSVERRVAAGVWVAVTLTAVAVTAIVLALPESAERNSGGAVLYDASGAPLARADSSGGGKEVICSSVTLAGGNGTLCLEPAPKSSTQLLDAVMAPAIATIVLALLAAFALLTMTRRHLRAVRLDVERAVADPSFAQRIDPPRGELASLGASVNDLLDQIQNRESELRRRTHDLEEANKDLESFAHTVSHDLRGPLGSILGFSDALRDGYGGEVTAEGKEYLHWIRESARQMQNLIEGLLQMSRLSRAEVQRTAVDLSAMAAGIATSLQKAAPKRAVDFAIAENAVTNGDEHLLRAVMENLIANSWKFTSKRDRAVIEFGMTRDNGHTTFFVRDNGAGFDPAYAAKMFRPFQRLHSSSEFEGTGIGLATVQRILQRHGGKAWAEGEPDKGATIYFTTGTS